MLVTISKVLDRNTLGAVKQALADMSFVDGRLSAGKVARRVKRNQEVAPTTPGLDQLNNLLMGQLVKNPIYQAVAMPLKIAAPYYVRYTKGMAYGEHIDDPIMRSDMPYRSDIAITLFISDIDDYEGGELVIKTQYGDNKIKLAAGSAVLYPASSLHRVEEVSQGERLVAVTWVQSAIRDPNKREILYGLYRAREKLLNDSPDAEETAQIDHSYVNLVRMWSEI
ncbi:MAG: Fe2+-dependent dioxygenase [Gammaproteobacteria bacterium]|nr:Fe2+-dependent dioxygenase [Gammaproteobacteria bacterium]